jgi:hypothetical protein
MDKFLRKPKNQKAAATVGSNDSDAELFKGSSEESEEGVAATTTTTLAQLLEEQRALAARIATLVEEDF